MSAEGCIAVLLAAARAAVRCAVSCASAGLATGSPGQGAAAYREAGGSRKLFLSRARVRDETGPQMASPSILVITAEAVNKVKIPDGAESVGTVGTTVAAAAAGGLASGSLAYGERRSAREWLRPERRAPPELGPPELGPRGGRDTSTGAKLIPRG